MLEKAGCAIILISTIAQTAIYQYSAWFAWVPPTLFESGPNGMPLDDLVLTVLGIGMALLLLTFLPTAGDKISEAYKSQRAFRLAIALLALAFIISIVGLGMYLWTIYLNPTLIEVCYFVAVLSLLSSFALLAL